MFNATSKNTRWSVKIYNKIHAGENKIIKLWNTLNHGMVFNQFACGCFWPNGFKWMHMYLFWSKPNLGICAMKRGLISDYRQCLDVFVRIIIWNNVAIGYLVRSIIILVLVSDTYDIYLYYIIPEVECYYIIHITKYTIKSLVLFCSYLMF